MVDGTVDRIPGLKVVAEDNYAGLNRWTTTYSIELAQPTPLLRIFKAMKPVTDATERNNVITVKLN